MWSREATASALTSAEPPPPFTSVSGMQSASPSSSSSSGVALRRDCGVIIVLPFVLRRQPSPLSSHQNKAESVGEACHHAVQPVKTFEVCFLFLLTLTSAW